MRPEDFVNQKPKLNVAASDLEQAAVILRSIHKKQNPGYMAREAYPYITNALIELGITPQGNQGDQARWGQFLGLFHKP